RGSVSLSAVRSLMASSKSWFSFLAKRRPLAGHARQFAAGRSALPGVTKLPALTHKRTAGEPPAVRCSSYLPRLRLGSDKASRCYGSGCTGDVNQRVAAVRAGSVLETKVAVLVNDEIGLTSEVELGGSVECRAACNLLGKQGLICGVG